MKDKIKKVITFIGFAVVVIATIMIAIESKTANKGFAQSTFETTNLADKILALALPSIFAICLIFASNLTLKNFGYAISSVNLAIGISAMGNGKTMLLGIGLIIMASASVLFFIEIIFTFFGYVINKTKGNCSRCDVTDEFSEVEKYAQMLAEGIITESEYSSMKAKIFAVDKKKVNSIDDLKKWKKLFDKNLISKEEYSSIKTKILK